MGDMNRPRRNDGQVDEDGIRVSYGKDSSDVAGSRADERGKKMGGSVTDLSHSITGTSANQGRT